MEPSPCARSSRRRPSTPTRLRRAGSRPNGGSRNQLVVERLGGFGDVYVTVLGAGGKFPRRKETAHIAMQSGPMLPGVARSSRSEPPRRYGAASRRRVGATQAREPRASAFDDAPRPVGARLRARLPARTHVPGLTRSFRRSGQHPCMSTNPQPAAQMLHGQNRAMPAAYEMGACLQALSRRADEPLEPNTVCVSASTSIDEVRKSENRRFAGTSKRLKGLEPSTFCMASRP
jgi:hypothetical protein